MFLDYEQQQALGITKTEAKVLQAATHEGVYLSELARRSGLPRGTVFHTVDRLQRRGWLESEPYGKRRLWRLSSSRKIKARLGEVPTDQDSNDPLITITDKKMRMQFADCTEYVVHTGVEKLTGIYERLSRAKKNHVLALESSETVNGATQYISQEQFHEFHQHIKDSKSFWSGIIAEDWYPTFLRRADKEVLKTMEGRQQVTYIVQPELLKDMGGLFIFDNCVCMVNWQTLTAVEIVDPAMVNLQKMFFQELFMSGKKCHNDDVVKEAMKYCRE